MVRKKGLSVSFCSEQQGKRGKASLTKEEPLDAKSSGLSMTSGQVKILLEEACRT